MDKMMIKIVCCKKMFFNQTCGQKLSIKDKMPWANFFVIIVKCLILDNFLKRMRFKFSNLGTNLELARKLTKNKGRK